VFYNFYAYKQQTIRQKVLNGMVASITRIKFAPNFLMNACNFKISSETEVGLNLETITTTSPDVVIVTDIYVFIIAFSYHLSTDMANN
jgi:hypothetical protein